MGHAPIVVVYVRRNCDADVYACYTYRDGSHLQLEQPRTTGVQLYPYSSVTVFLCVSMAFHS